MTTIKRFLSILLLFFLFHSCSVFDPPGQIPSYIHIDSIGLTANYTTDGTASHKITDAWVYVDQVLNGVYAMPATIPILASGVHEIDVHPGILVDGIQATRESYPFYTFYSNNYNLTTQQITTINPTVTYYPGIVPTWYEDFENPGLSVQTVAPNQDTIVKAMTNVFEGHSSGYIALSNPSNYYFECNTILEYPLPTDGSRSVYLEMNYMSTNTIRIGVLPIDPTNSYTYIDDTVLEINPSLTWNKIYIDLTSVCGSYPGSSFRIFIAALLDPGLNNAQIYIDNLKLLHQ